MIFLSEGTVENWVVLTHFKTLKDNTNNVVHGKFRSPLLQDTGIQRILPAASVLQKVSVVHNCDYGQCTFTNAEQTVVEEREASSKERYVFQHDPSNKVYLLNRFYLGESWKYIPDETEA